MLTATKDEKMIDHDPNEDLSFEEYLSQIEDELDDDMFSYESLPEEDCGYDLMDPNGIGDE